MDRSPSNWGQFEAMRPQILEVSEVLEAPALKDVIPA